MAVSKVILNSIKERHAQALFESRHPVGHEHRFHTGEYYRGMINALAATLRELDSSGSYAMSEDVEPYLVGKMVRIRIPATNAPVAAIAVGDGVYTMPNRLIPARHMGSRAEVLIGNQILRAHQLTGGYTLCVTSGA